ncbi:TonB-dependent receptor domain-containing protein [Sphingomonas lenta]|uniref:TonB-dependent receptor n=1 Tax=Sphingomonas lenta TaxID=1141887 RepID=A0A2A2SKE2_9SPHN|nr:TonB-dependent receptor [Sphingomonas lenta]PAX09688.1 TonB-dependent receptor [Sphingomonas lenta]
MTKRTTYASLLLLTTQLVAPAALAQTSGGSSSPTPTTSGSSPSAQGPTSTTPQTGAGTTGNQTQQTGDASATEAQAEQETVEVSTPGADPVGDEIVVVGRNVPNVVRATPQVVSILSSADIARTGEGDIAGALTRVTGLSVVGGGFVFVRGLGDRYSSSLLNGSPLPSPEPLRRSVPLDIFPTTIVSSALVQKTYSVNYPGEFGGGVINLTTRAIPDENFIAAGASIAADDITTSELGLVYDGGDADWIGYDDGTRDIPGFVRGIERSLRTGEANSGLVPTDQVARLSNAQTSLLLRNNQLPPNWSGELSSGTAFDIGSDRLGVVASISASNTFRTRSIVQQDTVSETGDVRNDFRTLLTDNRVVANALVGLGYEFGDDTIRWTNVYIHDTLKQGRASASDNYNNFSGLRFQQNTNWFERQLFESQLVGEFKLSDSFEVDVRGAYANSKRNAPYERQFDYLCVSQPAPGFNVQPGAEPNSFAQFQCEVNGAINAAGQRIPGVYAVTQRFTPFASIVFSELDEDLWSGQADATYKLNTERPFTLSAGYFYSDTDRTSTRLPFNFQLNTGAASAPGFPYNLYRPDLLLSPDVLNNATPLVPGPRSSIQLQFNSPLGAPIYDASLRIHAGYVQAEAEAADGLRATIGVRYETAREEVVPVGAPGTTLDNDYFLPAATITWNFAENQQLRASAYKTISRPQFRELAPQQFRDPDSDRLFIGNPGLTDSELYNVEGRYEWFFGRDQRFTLAGFYKRIDNPIEQVGTFPTQDSPLQTGFSYLPSATLYGGEVEIQKYFPLDFLGDFFATRRLLALANYTYTKSSINASAECVPNAQDPNQTTAIGGCPLGFGPADAFFRDGAPLTGQSDHLVNLQLGIEDTASLSQFTVLFNYASDRVTNRGPGNTSGAGFLPDIIERPGIRLDVVARQGFQVRGVEFEVKAEARNLTRTRYQERQEFDNGNVVFTNRFRQGRIFSLGLSTRF